MDTSLLVRGVQGIRRGAGDAMRNLSKSKLIAYRQCPKRLWLELHKPEQRTVSPEAEARFAIGDEVGRVARRIYDPEGAGASIEVATEGYARALERSTALLYSDGPIFEAGFSAEGAIAFADVMLPVGARRGAAWRMVEVKSAASVKDYHRDDAAIQAFVARAAGVPLEGIAVAHIDSGWSYPGGGDYRGLLVEQDLTEEAFARGEEVSAWIRGAQAAAGSPAEPERRTGQHCKAPFECGFLAYCQAREPSPEHAVAWLPRRSQAVKDFIETKAISDLADIPDELLSERQRRVKSHTLSGETYFDRQGAAAALAGHELPALFLDFETVSFAVPIWEGTRPYQQIPFQFSVHRLARDGRLQHAMFLDLSGADPSEACADALVSACDQPGPIFVYFAGFERSCIEGLAARFPRHAHTLEAIKDRLVDLLPVAREHFYHPSQRGSWSIKAVLPAMVPGLGYDKLDGIKHGGAAQIAYLEAIRPGADPERREEIGRQLAHYCQLDTYAMVRLWQGLSGRAELAL
jgi:hypothetical protein